MTRDELVEQCVKAFGEAWHATPEGKPGDRRRAGIAAIEPLIRADQRTDLRAKVEALHGSPNSALDWVLRVDVLALFDGDTDD